MRRGIAHRHQRCSSQLREDVAADVVALLGMRVPGEYEGADAEIDVCTQLAEHLIGVAAQRGAAAAAGAADTGPEMVLDETLVVGGVAHLGLTADAHRGVVEGALTNLLADLRVETAHQLTRGGTCLALALAHDHADTVPEQEGAPDARGATTQVVEELA
jgi:hypothetical protein